MDTAEEMSSNLAQDGLEVMVPWRDLLFLLLVSALVIAGSEPCPGTEMLGGRKSRHILANLGQDCIGSRLVDARD